MHISLLWGNITSGLIMIRTISEYSFSVAGLIEIIRVILFVPRINLKSELFNFYTSVSFPYKLFLMILPHYNFSLLCELQFTEFFICIEWVFNFLRLILRQLVFSLL
jgi:hypothetical protein